MNLTEWGVISLLKFNFRDLDIMYLRISHCQYIYGNDDILIPDHHTGSNCFGG